MSSALTRPRTTRSRLTSKNTVRLNVSGVCERRSGTSTVRATANVRSAEIDDSGNSRTFSAAGASVG